MLETALAWRYMTLAVFTASLILTIGLVAGGRVRAAFFPRLPGEVAVATLEMPNGVSADATRRVLERIEAAAEQVREELDGGEDVKVVKHLLVAMGAHPMGDAQQPSCKPPGCWASRPRRFTTSWRSTASSEPGTVFKGGPWIPVFLAPARDPGDWRPPHWSQPVVSCGIL